MFFRNLRKLGLSQAEKSLLRKTAKGELCDLSQYEGEKRIIRAFVLSDLWLQKHGWSVDPKGLHLKGAVIEGELQLVDSRLPFAMEFVNCEFRDGVDLSGAEVRYLKMLGCRVRHLIARNIETKEDIHLCDGFEAEGEVDLSGCRVKGELLIERCRINGAVNLSNASIQGSFVFNPEDVLSIDLTDAQVGEWDDQWSVDEGICFSWLEQRFWEWGVRKKEILLRWEKDTKKKQYCAKLLKYRIRGFSYNSVGKKISRIANENPFALGLWLALADDTAYDPQPYEQMARVLKMHGHEQAYRELAIAKRIERRRRGNLPAYLAVFDFLLLDVPVRYGYKPWRAIAWGFIFCLLASLLFYYNMQAIVPSDSDILLFTNTQKRNQIALKDIPLKDLTPEGYPYFHPIIYTIDLFVPVIDLHQERYWVPNRAHEYGGLLWFVKWILILSGWYLTTLFVSSFTGLLKVE